MCSQQSHHHELSNIIPFDMLGEAGCLGEAGNGMNVMVPSPQTDMTTLPLHYTITLYHHHLNWW